jgi:hypothetical protein
MVIQVTFQDKSSPAFRVWGADSLIIPLTASDASEAELFIQTQRANVRFCNFEKKRPRAFCFRSRAGPRHQPFARSAPPPGGRHRKRQNFSLVKHSAQNNKPGEPASVIRHIDFSQRIRSETGKIFRTPRKCKGSRMNSGEQLVIAGAGGDNAPIYVTRLSRKPSQCSPLMLKWAEPSAILDCSAYLSCRASILPSCGSAPGGRR